jgi:type I restriction enzyme S subunit
VEVKPGYKQSEVGIIPEEWETAAVADLVEPAAPICYGVVQVGQNIESGVPIVAIKYVKEIAHAPLHRTAVHLEQPYARSRPKGGDVLISIKGTIGRVGIVPDGFQGNISRELARLRIRGDSCPDYIAHQLESGDTQERIMRSVVGTTRLEFSIATLRKFPLPIPPTLPEQRAIAAALSDVDALLGGLDRLIAKKRDLKQAAMQQLLTGQIRLPGFSGEWEVKRLGELGEIRSGGTPSTTQPHFWDGEVPWCTPTDITALRGYKYLVNTARMISSAGLQASSAEVIPARSLIMTSRATIGACAINLVPMTTNQGFKNVVPFAQFDVEFLYYLMTTQEAGLVALCGGSTFLEISKKQLSAYGLLLPRDRAEQTAIAAVLSDMDAELAALEARRDKTRNLKQAMMQELLTGRIRII